MKTPALLSTLLLAAACGGSSAPSAPPPAPPPTPQGLVATAETVLGLGVAHLGWTASTGATSYRVSYDTAPLTDLSPTVATLSTTLDLTPLLAGQAYFVAVAAVSAEGASPRSATQVVTPPLPPPTPEGLSAWGESLLGEGVAHLSWTASAGAAAYLVAYDTGPVTDQSPSAFTASTSLDLPHLTPGQDYFVSVLAMSAQASSARCAAVQVTPPALPPAPPPTPAGLAATGETVVGEGVAHLSWSPAPGAATYLVAYDTVPITDLSPTVTSASTALDLAPLLAGQGYFVAVTAVNPAGSSPRSAAVTVTPPLPPAPPTAVSVSELYDAGNVLDHVRVTWTASADLPPGYQLFRSTDGGQTWSARGATADTTLDDPLAGDEVCLRLRYRVAAARPGASSRRSSDEAVRGTLLLDSADTGTFDTQEAQSPYLVVGQVSVEASTFHVSPRTVLCLGPGATLSFAEGASFLAWGMLRMVGTAAQPARFTVHGAGGAAPTAGVIVSTSPHWLDEVSAHHDPATGRGSTLQFAALDDLQGLSFGGRVLIRESRFTSLSGGMAVGFDTFCPDLQDSTFDGFFPSFTGSYAAEPGSAFKRNLLLNQGGLGASFAGFWGTGSPSDTFAAGQFSQNAFGATMVSGATFPASGVLALGGNYWGGGQPGFFPQPPLPGVTVDASFDPVLPAAPAAGASW